MSESFQRGHFVFTCVLFGLVVFLTTVFFSQLDALKEHRAGRSLRLHLNQEVAIMALNERCDRAGLPKFDVEDFHREHPGLRWP